MSNVLVICIFRFYVVESFQEKMHDFLARKVFARVLMVQSFSLSSDFLFISIFPSIATSVVSDLCIVLFLLFLFHVTSFSVDCSSESQQEKKILPILCCTGFGHAGY